jgi:protein-S-isoprenylcysteine O-methyltransferase Ste14
VSLPEWLGAAYGISELALSLFKRAGKDTSAADRGSLRLLWGVIIASVFLAFVLADALPQCSFGPRQPLLIAGLAIFGAGVALRWYAILVLGRFFTVNVAIARDQPLIEDGPYRWIRHPSYAGALAAFLGLGISLCNWASVAALAAPTLAVFVWRMHIEEAALLGAFGKRYEDYIRRTKRLIPAIY